MKTKIILLFLFLFTGLLLVSENIKVDNNIIDSVIISEVIPDNFSLLADENGDYPDIVELYNASDNIINLKDYGLSDNEDILHKFKLPEYFIQPGEYLLIYLSDEEKKNNIGNSIYCDFKLDKDGEKLFLTDSKGNILSAISFRFLKSDMSYGISDNGYVYYETGSPGRFNEGIVITDYSQYMQNISPIPKICAGIYSEPVDLNFEESNYDIRYTTDCSNPDIDSNLYTESIKIDYTDKLVMRISNIITSFYPVYNLKDDDVNKGLVVKARYFDGEEPVGEIFTGTYFVWEEGINRYSLDIISIATEDDNLFSTEDGIYVVGNEYYKIAPDSPYGLTPANYHQRGKEWERPANIEFFDSEGQIELTQNIGIRIHGNWSRSFNKKSFKLYARDEYGDDTMNINLFDDKSEYKRLILRNSGNDINHSIFRDILATELASENIDSADYEPVILFVNGEYFGIYNIRETIEAYYLANKYDIKEDKINIIEQKINNELELVYGDASEIVRYSELINFIDNNDLTIDNNYEYVISMIDIDNLIDYYLIQIYIANNDWMPNNIRMWRYTGESGTGVSDGKYRYLLFDCDHGFGLVTFQPEFKYDTFEYLINNQDPVFRKLMLNDEFKRQFLNTMADELNSKLSENSVLEQIDYLESLYINEIEENLKRWDFPTYSSSEEYSDSMVGEVEEFVSGRSDYLFNQVSNHYGLTVSNYSINSNQGTVVINNNYSVNKTVIRCFNNYPTILTAINNDDYIFDYWKISDESNNILAIKKDASIELNINENIIIESIYKKRD